MTREQRHISTIKTLANAFERDFSAVAGSSFRGLQNALDAAIADGIPACRFPPEFRAWGVLRLAEGESYLAKLMGRLDRDHWR